MHNNVVQNSENESVFPRVNVVSIILEIKPNLCRGL